MSHSSCALIATLLLLVASRTVTCDEYANQQLRLQSGQGLQVQLTTTTVKGSAAADGLEEVPGTVDVRLQLQPDALSTGAEPSAVTASLDSTINQALTAGKEQQAAQLDQATSQLESALKKVQSVLDEVAHQAQSTGGGLEQAAQNAGSAVVSAA